MHTDPSLLDTLFVGLGTFFVSLFVSAIGPTGGLQLAVVAALLPASLAIPLHAWITGFSAGFRAWNLRAHIDWRYTLVFAPLSVLAAALAIGLSTKLNGSMLQIIVGLHILQSGIRRDAHAPARDRSAGPVVSALVTGFLTVFVGATGPLLFSLMSRRFESRERLMGTHSACLVVQHASKVVLFGIAGSTVFGYPVLLVAATCAAWLGTTVGTRMMGELNETTYRRILSVLMTVSGVVIVVQATLSLTKAPSADAGRGAPLHQTEDAGQP